MSRPGHRHRRPRLTTNHRALPSRKRHTSLAKARQLGYSGGALTAAGNGTTPRVEARHGPDLCDGSRRRRWRRTLPAGGARQRQHHTGLSRLDAPRRPRDRRARHGPRSRPHLGGPRVGRTRSTAARRGDTRRGRRHCGHQHAAHHHRARRRRHGAVRHREPRQSRRHRGLPVRHGARQRPLRANRPLAESGVYGDTLALAQRHRSDLEPACRHRVHPERLDHVPPVRRDRHRRVAGGGIVAARRPHPRVGRRPDRGTRTAAPRAPGAARVGQPARNADRGRRRRARAADWHPRRRGWRRHAVRPARRRRGGAGPGGGDRRHHRPGAVRPRPGGRRSTGTALDELSRRPGPLGIGKQRRPDGRGDRLVRTRPLPGRGAPRGPAARRRDVIGARSVGNPLDVRRRRDERARVARAARQSDVVAPCECSRP